MNISLKGKTALVAGSTGGIGYATALEMANLGARVILIARNEDKLIQVKKELEEISNENHSYIVADFSKPSEVEEAVTSFLKTGGPVDILVNNTGGPPGGPASEATPADYVSAFEMHLLCNHIITTACIPGMKASGGGRVINVISTSVKQPLPNLGVSNTIRGAVANWAKTLANELGPHGITVNNVLPGATQTGRLESIASKKAEKTGSTREEALAKMAQAVPLRRIGDPSEIAAGICFLASPAASYISGINLPVDGGRTSSL
ncbi:MAG: SDR family oxidoreductase [Cryomorphaceae bacterium]|nr:SDR family oxidoreductase [Flavobacteriales bacterium]